MSKKNEQVSGLRTEVLKRILDNLASPENMPRDEQHPLGGLVHLDGIGQVTVTQLRAELSRRSYHHDANDPCTCPMSLRAEMPDDGPGPWHSRGCPQYDEAANDA